MTQISRSSRPLVIAHQGASERAPGNSVAAIRLANELGADWVEVDVRMTTDGSLVLVHDEDVAGLVVVETALPELRAASDSLATLDEGLEAAGGMGVDLELKPPVGDVNEFVSRIKTATRGFRGPLLVSSFWLPVLPFVAQEISEADIGVLTGHRYDPDGRIALSHAIDHSYPVALPEDPVVTAELITTAHQAGVRIITWTVDSSERIRQLSNWGIDGIITNEPDRARTVLD